MADAGKHPTVTGPVRGGAHGWPFAGFLGDLDALGYVEEEYFLEGVAASYRPVGALGVDGRWSVEPAGSAPYKTRFLVQRPKDASRFNGTVLVEWANVSSGYEVLVTNGPGRFEAGIVFVAVSAQYVGVHGHEGDPRGLTGWDAERYGSLTHPGDSYGYDIFSQMGRLVGPNRTVGGVDPLHGLVVERLLATGGSQSSWRLATYLNAIQPRERVYGGALPTVWRGVASRFEDGVLDMMKLAQLSVEEGHKARGIPTRIRDDLDIPVMVVNSEGETLLHAAVRQPDTDRFRFWEVTGASHFPLSMVAPLSDYALRDFGAPMAMPPMPFRQAEVPTEGVIDAAIGHLDRWVRTGAAPPSLSPIEVQGSPPHIVRDAHGIALGGVRLPEVEVPVAVNDGSANGLMGSNTPFDAGTLRRLYPTHQAYVDKVAAAARGATERGAILPAVAEGYVREAKRADVPPKG